MKEDSQDSAIIGWDQPFEGSFEGSLEGSFEGSKDWNLNIDDTSQEILQARPAMVMGKCPLHCMGGSFRSLYAWFH